ncbi:MAG TPA: PilZ domain-containing protein [Nitrososphaera sp.]|nr:PilZ domain-containing protein [Nitrososphaera sp.]
MVNKASVDSLEREALLRWRWKIDRRKINADDPPDSDKDVGTAFSRGLERRIKPRVRTPFPATVRGVNTDGEAFESKTRLNSLSAGGLHLNLEQRVTKGSELFVIIWLAPYPNAEVATPRVAVRGRVVRLEEIPGGACGVAMTITHYKFL